MTLSSGERLPELLDTLLEQMISQQRAKVLEVARTINARLTQDDLLSPLDFPELAGDGRFNFEDGLLAGLLSAQIAVRAELRRTQG